MTVREGIFAWTDAGLGAIAGVELVERMPSGDPDRFNALSIFDGGQKVLSTGTFSTRYALLMTIEGYVEGGTGPEAHAALSALYADVIGVMMAEPPIGGLAEIVEERGMRIDVATLADERRLGFALDFDIQFSTRRGDPTAQ